MDLDVEGVLGFSETKGDLLTWNGNARKEAAVATRIGFYCLSWKGSVPHTNMTKRGIRGALTRLSVP